MIGSVARDFIKLVPRRSAVYRILRREGTICFRLDGSLLEASGLDVAPTEGFGRRQDAIIQKGEAAWNSTT